MKVGEIIATLTAHSSKFRFFNPQFGPFFQNDLHQKSIGKLIIGLKCYISVTI